MVKILSKKIPKNSIQDVFDICMPTTHNFIAEGIVVHNCDFGSRDLLVGVDKQSGFLYGKYGDCAAQISTRMLMRLKSSIKDVNRFINKGSVEPEIDKIAEGLPVPPQGVSDQDFVYGYTDTDGNEIEGILETSDVLKKYIDDRPNEWKIVERALGLARNNSSHASAFAIANKPIRNIVPTFSLGKSENIIQYDAKSTEMAKIIKYDFLCVSAYKDINMCIKLINTKNILSSFREFQSRAAQSTH